LRLVTLNTWKGDGAYQKRLVAMAAGLASLSPDIVALQEVLLAPDAGYDTAAYLATALGLHAANAPGRRKPREVEGRTVESASGLALLSRFPIRSQRSMPLTKDPRNGDRAALIAKVEVHGGSLTVACLHFTHFHDANDVRRRQWEETQLAVAGAATVLVAGDFNSSIDLFDLGRFIDSRQACGEPDRSTLVDSPSGQAIDHILFTAGRGLTTTGWRTALGSPPPGCDVTPSDHLAVVADFEWV
jgi:endonuclease/exonuclease/phosphatase family metal-dependent hydrolase